MLAVNHLIGFGGESGPSSQVVITRTANPTEAASASPTATFSTQAIGTASGDRIVAICITWETASRDVTGVTIDYGTGATAMTLAAGVGQPGSMGARIYYLNAQTGTTATFVVTFSGNVALSVKASIYVITGATSVSGSTDNSNDMDATDPLSLSITIPQNGGALGVVGGEGSADAKTWANLTEDLDANGGDHRHTTATSTTAGSVTVTCRGNLNGEVGQMAIAVFSP